MKRKNNIIKLEVERKRTRAHVVLFCEGTPFKPKREASRTEYQRKPKHPKTLFND